MWRVKKFENLCIVMFQKQLAAIRMCSMIDAKKGKSLK